MTKRTILAMSCLAACAALPPSPARAAVTTTGPVITRTPNYDYSPSVIQSGGTRTFWWCGQAVNPADPSQATDTIQYYAVDLVHHTTVGPLTVLAETPGAWDSLLTCNAAVVQGTFPDPLGDGITYGYAMYYVGTSTPPGVNAQIGVAFSSDGIAWKKYPQPVVSAPFDGTYGVAEPAPFNADGGSGIHLFYEKDAGHYLATSTDGVHFSTVAKLTANGLRDGDVSWGDIAYDYASDAWYAVFDNPLRPPATTGNVIERGQYGSTLYRIPASDLFTGSWEEVATIDTNQTGYESNFIAGLLRDPFGNVNVGAYPSITVYTSSSVPRPSATATPAEAGASGDPSHWDIVESSWTPDQPLRPLIRYFDVADGVHEVSTGWVDPALFQRERSLGRLYEARHGAATRALYGCKSGDLGYFVSPDRNCEGQRVLGLDGYAYPSRTRAAQVPLYRCFTGRSHFVSDDPACEGQTTESLLGFAEPD